MPNWSQEEIAEALAGVVEAADEGNPCVTDKKFSESDQEIIPLIKSQNTESLARGSALTWEGLPTQTEDGSCEVITTYRYSFELIEPYLNDNSDGATSDILFKRRLVAINEALNAKLNLDLDNRVRHLMLVTEEPFSLIEFGSQSEGEMAHYFNGTIDVTVVNTY